MPQPVIPGIANHHIQRQNKKQTQKTKQNITSLLKCGRK
jgi:hypothetical protein